MGTGGRDGPDWRGTSERLLERLASPARSGKGCVSGGRSNLAPLCSCIWMCRFHALAVRQSSPRPAPYQQLTVGVLVGARVRVMLRARCCICTLVHSVLLRGAPRPAVMVPAPVLGMDGRSQDARTPTKLRQLS